MEEWIQIEPEEFIISSHNQVSTIDVIWTHCLTKDTCARTCIINNNSQFQEILSKSYLPWYKKYKNYDEPDAENFTVIEKSRILNQNEIDQFLKRLYSHPIITTAYHTKLKKRLVVDGCKRVCGAQYLINNSSIFPSIKVIECYGENIHNIFKLDFNPIIKNLKLHKL